MRVLITGACGFLGSHALQHHLNLNHQVIAIDNLCASNVKNIQGSLSHPNLRYQQTDVLHTKNWDKLLEKVDLVYHFAALVGVFQELNHPYEVLKINIETTDVLLEKIVQYAPQARVFVASSSEVYGNQVKEKFREDLDICLSMNMPHRLPYPLSKLVNEVESMFYYEQKKLAVTILRVFNIIGPHQQPTYGMVVPRYIAAARQNKPLQVFGDGQQQRCFCDVRDFLGFIDDLVQTKKSIGKIINIGNTFPIKIIDLAKLIIQLSHSKSNITFLSYQDAYHEKYEFNQYRCPDLSLLYSLTQYRHQWTLEKTLIDLIHQSSTK